MKHMIKSVIVFIGETTLVLVFWLTIIILTLFFFEYLGERVHQRMTKDNVIEVEEMIQTVDRVLPEGDFIFEQHGHFENGTLSGWGASGEAFLEQPTFEDNPFFRGIPLRTNIEGQFWIGTFERHPNQSFVRGSVKGDESIGTLTSCRFKIDKPTLSFLIGGGKGPNTRVELLIDGEVVLFRTGENSEAMRRVQVDVSPYMGKYARICLVDYARGHWGHINFDDVRLEDEYNDQT